MMKIEKIGTIFAERELDGRNNGSPCKVVVRLGRPVPNEKDGSWCCPYSVTGPVGERLFYGAGVDSLQALTHIIQCAVKRRWSTASESLARELFAPPGSNRSGGGGNKAVGASGVEGRYGDSASVQAVT